MKTGLGLYNKYRRFFAYINLIRFQFVRKVFGFDVANQFIQKVDKTSLILILKKNKASIGKDCDIETGIVFHNCRDYSNFIVGNNCHIGKNCFFDLRDKVQIRDNVVISMLCTFVTHIDMSKSSLSKKYPPAKGSIIIDHDTYIGSSSTVLMNTIIGSCSIVGSGSVVIKDIVPYTMVGGVPAVFIKKLN